MRICIDRTGEISLIPYLARGADTPLVGLSFAFADPVEPDCPVPFTRPHDSDPLTLLRPASFVTASGRELKRVFLLLQKDRYLLETNGLWPLTNTDIDTAWRKAFAGGGSDGYNPASNLLPGQINEHGVPIPFSALFYCRSERAFFHPPCPGCGLPLTLCRDDEILLTSALEPYSGSLKRYLYCAGCCRENQGVFYARDLADEAPRFIRDLHGLIDDFGRLRSTDGVLPCTGCANRDTCYGIRGAAHSMIVPFSFYPFHLLIFDAMTLPAEDFLPLISGATIDELKTSLAARNAAGRIGLLDSLRKEAGGGVSLFPADDDRYFLEVLYLKLSFLADILGHFLAPSGTMEGPDMRLSLKNIWVGIPPGNGLLPCFWNFRTKVLDIVRPPDPASFFAGAASPRPLQAGLLWFQVLLANNSQSGRELLPALKEAVSGNCGFEDPDGRFSTPLFSPEQIFWKPQGKRVGSWMRSLWGQSLTVGLDLLREAIRQDPAWSFKDFFGTCEKVRGRVKAAIFDEVQAVNERRGKEYISAEDEVIRRALMRIIGKWTDSRKATLPPESPTKDFDTMETVILPPATAAALVSPLSGNKAPDWSVAPACPGERPAQASVASPDLSADALLETVLLVAGGTGREHQPDKRQEQGDGFMPETIILSPGARQDIFPGATGAGSAEKSTEEAVNGDALLETVVLGSRKSDVKAKKWRD